jgi:PAS domain S-box-containing protein
MRRKPSYEELEQKIEKLEKASLKLKEAKEALRECEKNYRRLAESLPDAVYEFDLVGRVTYVNEAAVHMFGYTRDEIPDEIRVEDIITEEEKDVARENLYEIQKRKTFEGERTFVRKDGTRFIGEFLSGPLYKGKKVVGVRGVLRDITRRKRVEEELRESEREKETILNSLLEHVIYEDKEMKILWANRAACESADLTRDELIGRHCYEIWPKRYDPCPDCPVIQAVETGQPQETTKDTPDGRAWYIRGYPVRDAQGTIVGAIETTLDITESKQAELALREKEQKLERQAHDLEEINTALKVLLEHREHEKKRLEKNILANAQKLIFPYIEKLENSRLEGNHRAYVDIIRSNLTDLISPFANALSSKYAALTPSEIQIADMIKQGRTSKEVASLLNVSQKAVSFHRGNIRRKLGLTHQKINLRSHLQSLAT